MRGGFMFVRVVSTVHANYLLLCVRLLTDVCVTGICCPGGVYTALQYEPWELGRARSAGHHCGEFLFPHDIRQDLERQPILIDRVRQVPTA